MAQKNYSLPFAVGDTIRFSRIVHGARKVGHRTDFKTGRPIVVPSVPEQILPQSGEGTITSINKEPKKVDGVEVWVAKVHAGEVLKVVSAVLDDAVLAARPLTLELDVEIVDTSSGPNVYGGDAKGIA